MDEISNLCGNVNARLSILKNATDNLRTSLDAAWVEIPRGVMGAVKMEGANNVEFHAVHWIGQQRDDGKPRPIIAQFVKRERINDLWYLRKELANSPNHRPVILVPEYRHETAYEQKKLANALRNARKMNLAPAYIKNGRIFIQGNSYSADKIPECFRNDEAVRQQSIPAVPIPPRQLRGICSRCQSVLVVGH